MRNTKFRDVIMLIAGAYLAYLGVKIIRDGFVGGGMEGKFRALGLVIAIFFLVFGAGVIIRSIRHLFMNGSNDQTEELLEQAETGAGEGSEAAADAEVVSGELPGTETAEDAGAAPETGEKPRDLRWSYDNSASVDEDTKGE